MLNYISIVGSKSDLTAIMEIEGVLMRHQTAILLDNGDWTIKAYASNDALTELTRQEVDYFVLVDTEKMQEQLNGLENSIDYDNADSVTT